MHPDLLSDWHTGNRKIIHADYSYFLAYLIFSLKKKEKVL